MNDDELTTQVLLATLERVDDLWFLVMGDGIRFAVSPWNCKAETLIGKTIDWEVRPQRRASSKAMPMAEHFRIVVDPDRVQRGRALQTKHDAEDLTQPGRRVVEIDATGEEKKDWRVCLDCARRLPPHLFPDATVRRCTKCGGKPRSKSVRATSAGLPGHGKRR